MTKFSVYSSVIITINLLYINDIFQKTIFQKAIFQAFVPGTKNIFREIWKSVFNKLKGSNCSPAGGFQKTASLLINLEGVFTKLAGGKIPLRSRSLRIPQRFPKENHRRRRKSSIHIFY